MDVFCGIDWAEDHHDIALAGRDGQLLARRRISDDAAGLIALLELLTSHGDTADDPVPVAIETPRGLLTACLRATGRAVYPINPMAVARYRDRHSVAGRKSDHGDAVVLANILRTDAHAHRALPADTELAQAIAVLARAQQDAVWARTAAHNKLRSHLREYYPGFLAAFADARGGITRPEPPPPWPARSPPRSYAACCARPGAAAASTPKPPGCAPHSRPRRCASPRSSNKPWAARPSRCSASSTLPATAPATSSKPPSSLLTSTRTPGSSPASQGSARSPAPGCSPRPATTDPASRMPKDSRPLFLWFAIS